MAIDREICRMKNLPKRRWCLRGIGWNSHGEPFCRWQPRVYRGIPRIRLVWKSPPGYCKTIRKIRSDRTGSVRLALSPSFGSYGVLWWSIVSAYQVPDSLVHAARLYRTPWSSLFTMGHSFPCASVPVIIRKCHWSHKFVRTVYLFSHNGRIKSARRAPALHRSPVNQHGNGP